MLDAVSKAKDGRRFLTCAVRLSREKMPERFVELMESLAPHLARLGLTPLLCGAAADAEYAAALKARLRAAVPAAVVIDTFLDPPALAAVFAEADAKLLEYNAARDAERGAGGGANFVRTGSCATVCLLVGNTLHVANVGDCRVVRVDGRSRREKTECSDVVCCLFCGCRKYFYRHPSLQYKLLYVVFFLPHPSP